MKKTLIALSTMCICATAVLADGNAFTPLDFNDTQYNAPVTTSYTTPTAKGAVETEAVGNPSMQNAILQLDNAQVDIRTELMNAKTRYTEVDSQYKATEEGQKTFLCYRFAIQRHSSCASAVIWLRLSSFSADKIRTVFSA